LEKIGEVSPSVLVYAKLHCEEWMPILLPGDLPLPQDITEIILTIMMTDRHSLGTESMKEVAARLMKTHDMSDHLPLPNVELLRPWL